MPTDFLPAIFPSNGMRKYGDYAEQHLMNCFPWPLMKAGEWGATIRGEFTLEGSSSSSSAGRGRGVFGFADYGDFYLDEDTFYYSGGNQDLTVTTSPGYTENTGFDEDIVATFVPHLISGVPSMVIINAGHISTNASAKHGNIWYITDTTSAPVAISATTCIWNDSTAGDRVSLIRGGASLDGYLFVGDISGKIYNSTLNDITTGYSDFITAERAPDVGIYIGKHHDHVVYIGSESIEFFYNAGNASGSPLARRQDVSYSIGCVHPNAIADSGDVIYFVGIDLSRRPRVYKLENFQLTIISSNEIERLLSLSVLVRPDLSALDEFKTDYYFTYCAIANSSGLMLTAGSRSFHYHLGTGIWSNMSFGASPTYPGNLTNWVTAIPMVSYNYGGPVSTFGIYQMTNGDRYYTLNAIDNDALADQGISGPPDIWINFGPWNAGTDRRKIVKTVRVITDNRGSSSGSYQPITANLVWKDMDRAIAVDSGAPSDFGSSMPVNLNLTGAKVYRQGACRSRVYGLLFPLGHGTVTVVKGLEIDYEIVGE